MDEFEEQPLDEIEEKRLKELLRIDWHIGLLQEAKKNIKNSKEPLTTKEAINKLLSTMDERINKKG